jgi:hypothetical protein
MKYMKTDSDIHPEALRKPRKPCKSSTGNIQSQVQNVLDTLTGLYQISQLSVFFLLGGLEFDYRT